MCIQSRNNKRIKYLSYRRNVNNEKDKYRSDC